MFTLRLAWRYAFSRSNRHRNASLVIMGGIAVGMLAIVIMLSLMNSLQSDLLDQVKSVESFHIQVSFPATDLPGESVEEIRAQLAELAHVTQVFPHINTQVLVQDSASGRSTTARLRIVDSSIWMTDNPFASVTRMIRGSFPLEDETALGVSLGMKLAAQVGDELRMTVLVSGKTVVLAPATVRMTVSGIYRTALPEFDSSTLITDIDPLLDSIGQKRVLYGIYLDNQSVDRGAAVVDEISRLYPTATVRTWQQVNSAFYSALTLEKILMYLFLFFMFVILGVNMKNASSRLLHAKMRELAILRAVGSGRSLATRVFLGQAVLVTIIGEIVGVASGIVLGKHIGKVFSWLNSLQYVVTGRNNVLLSYPFATQVKPLEVVTIFVSVLILSLCFTYVGCRRMLGKEPMEMLYHD